MQPGLPEKVSID
jgi:hypothetical protein